MSDTGREGLLKGCSDGSVHRGLEVKLERSFSRLEYDSDGQGVDSARGTQAELAGIGVGIDGESLDGYDSEESELSSGSLGPGSAGQSGTPWGSTAGDLLRCNPLYELGATPDSSSSNSTTSEGSEC